MKQYKVLPNNLINTDDVVSDMSVINENFETVVKLSDLENFINTSIDTIADAIHMWNNNRPDFKQNLNPLDNIIIWNKVFSLEDELKKLKTGLE